METRPILSDIAIVPLSLESYGTQLGCGFSGFSAEKQIEIIVNRLNQICEDLKIKKPDAMWIILWREYGISEGRDKKKLPTKIKEKLIQEMSLIAKKYPNLVIIAGTISTLSPIPATKKQEKVERIAQYYKDQKWIVDRYQTKGRSFFDTDETFFNEHEQVINAREKNTMGLSVVKNACLVFYGDKLWKHHKSIPINERRNFPETCIDNLGLFQPGSKKNGNNSSVLTVNHPITGLPVTIGIEICAEHLLSVLQQTSLVKPLFHFVLSDTTTLSTQHMHGDYVLQVDRSHAPRLIVLNELNNQFSVSLYHNYVMINPYCLEGPLKKDYLFIHQVLDKLQAAFFNNPDHEFMLETLRDNFLDKVKEYDNNPCGVVKVYNELRAILKSLDYHVPLKSLANDLRELLAAQEKAYPYEMEYQTLSTNVPLHSACSIASPYLSI
jgi:hypothetical protein